MFRSSSCKCEVRNPPLFWSAATRRCFAAFGCFRRPQSGQSAATSRRTPKRSAPRPKPEELKFRKTRVNERSMRLSQLHLTPWELCRNCVLCLRRVLARTARLVLVAAACRIPWLASAEPASRDLVRLENEKPGRAGLALTLRANRQRGGRPDLPESRATARGNRPPRASRSSSLVAAEPECFNLPSRSSHGHGLMAARAPG